MKPARLFVSIVAAAAACVGVAYAAAWLALDRSAVARALIWMDAGTDDHTRFAARRIPGSDRPYTYGRAPGYPDALPERIALPGGHGSLETLLASTETTAFLVIADDVLLFERYFNGSSHDDVQTSFSVAKSFNSAMLGAALADGSIASADDPITRYIPELRERDPRFETITVRHLVTMSSGLHYEETGLPWSDDALTYYAPDLRALALQSTIEREPGRQFHYNNYNPLLFGMILERATGRRVADYLAEKIWRPMGAEADATWSLDSEWAGFEKMESGINARAIDFAKLGSLYLHRGTFNGQPILPPDWIDTSTAKRFDTGIAAVPGYGHWWWTDEDAELGPYYSARGNKGQFLFVFPRRRLVVARFGRDYGGVNWSDVAEAVARAL